MTATATDLITLRVTPLVSRSRWGAEHTVIVQNHGTRSTSVRLDAVDDSGGLVLTLSAPGAVVAPGEDVTLNVAVRPRRRSFRRRARAHAFHVVAGGGLPAKAVHFQDPVRWRPPVVVAAATLVVVALVALVALAGRDGPVATAGSSGGLPTPAAQPVPPVCGDAVDVAIASFTYCPGTVTVASGTEVTWVNRDAVPHTVTFESVDSGLLADGDSFVTRFDQPGTFSYYCRLHPSMRATVVVT